MSSQKNEKIPLLIRQGIKDTENREIIADKEKQLLLNFAAANVTGICSADLRCNAATMMNKIGCRAREKSYTDAHRKAVSLPEKGCYLAIQASPDLLPIAGTPLF